MKFELNLELIFIDHFNELLRKNVVEKLIKATEQIAGSISAYMMTDE